MTAGPSTNPDWMHHETILPGPGDGDRRCGNCDKTDGLVYTSNPPMRKCTITGKFHLYNDVCDAPQTNADRIRAMSDEKIAGVVCTGCPPGKDVGQQCTGDGACYDCWLDWLKSPVGGDGDD